MNKPTLVMAIVLGLGSTQSVRAADLAITAEPPAARDWTGFYAGVHAGYGWTELRSEPTDAYGGLEPGGFFGGGQAGYNHQFSNKLVLGIEADVSFTSQKDSVGASFGDPLSAQVEFGHRASIDSFGTVRGRIGYAAGRLLPYVTGGLAWANAEMDYQQTVTVGGVVIPEASGGASDKQTFSGWTVGGGLEYAITDQITAKAEYLYADFGSRAFDLGTPNPADLAMQTVRLGLNYSF